MAELKLCAPESWSPTLGGDCPSIARSTSGAMNRRPGPARAGNLSQDRGLDQLVDRLAGPPMSDAQDVHDDGDGESRRLEEVIDQYR
jgi:hypothetical protein